MRVPYSNPSFLFSVSLRSFPTLGNHPLIRQRKGGHYDNNDIVIIDFWAEWCGPCKQFGPVYETVSEKFPDMKFTKCDTEKEPDLTGAFGVQSIPTLAIFREKILLSKQALLMLE